VRRGLRPEALDWLEEAHVDLRRAERALSDGDYAISCFFSHQAIEKALKAVVIGLARKRPPHVHDLTLLYTMVEEFLELPDEVKKQLPEVSQYYVTTRYPNAGLLRPSVSFNKYQAEKALEVAKHVLKRVREALPAGEGQEGP